MLQVPRIPPRLLPVPATTGSTTRQRSSRSTTSGRPNMTLTLSGLANLSDQSGTALAGLSYSPVNNFTLLAAARVVPRRRQPGVHVVFNQTTTPSRATVSSASSAATISLLSTPSPSPCGSLPAAIVLETIQGGIPRGSRPGGPARCGAACFTSPHDAPHPRVRGPGCRVLPPRPYRGVHVPSLRGGGGGGRPAPAARCGSGDVFTTHHRGHGIFLARGADPGRMFAEVFGRREGYCAGKGGSMHIADAKLGHMGANAIVGANIPISLGGGFSMKYLKTGGASVAFFGDGALNQGVLYESMNMAALWKLPGGLPRGEQPVRDGNPHRPGIGLPALRGARRDIRRARRRGGRHGRRGGRTAPPASCTTTAARETAPHSSSPTATATTATGGRTPARTAPRRKRRRGGRRTPWRCRSRGWSTKGFWTKSRPQALRHRGGR